MLPSLIQPIDNISYWLPRSYYQKNLSLEHYSDQSTGAYVKQYNRQMDGQTDTIYRYMSCSSKNAYEISISVTMYKFDQFVIILNEQN